MSLTITIPGAVNVTTGAMAPAVLTIGVGVPGAAGPAGPAGPGVPAGGTAGQFLQKIDGVNYNTDWVTLNLGAYAPLASPVFTGDPRGPTAALGDNDTSLATTAFVQQELLSGTANAKNLEVYVRNQTGSTIPAGSIVYINGATGNRPTITLAQANNDANSAQTFGFTKASIANNGFGFVIVRGECEALDTSSLTEGVQLYLSPTTPGAWTTTKPSAPQHLVYVGICVRAHPTQGVILVAVQNGYELPELHDVSITSVANNDLLAYESSSTLWKNKSFGTLGLLTSSSLTGYATQSFVAANYAPIAAGLPVSGTVGQVLTKNSGTNYDASWATLVPGDRYLTTSSTSNTIGTGSKTFTVGTGLSYSSQQDVVISFDATNHMHALVTSYNSGTGALVVNVQSVTGSGTYTAWTINVGGTTPLQSVEWGEILGTLGDQSDLASALNGKLESTTAASTYAALAGATFTGEVITPASTTSNAGLTITPGVAPTSPSDGEIWATTNDLQVRLNGVTETLAEQSWVTAGFYPLTGNPSGFLTSAALTPYALLSGATFTGLVTTPAATTTTAGLNVPHGAAPTTPINGDVWTTTSGLFARINAGTQQFAPLGSNNTFSNASSTYGSSTATGTINVASGATISGSTKTVNIGTGGVSGSTTTITIGSSNGGTTTFNGTLNAGGNVSLGTFTGATSVSVANGATTTGLTKTVNIGTGGLAGSTSNITIGSTTGTSTTTLQGATNITGNLTTTGTTTEIANSTAAQQINIGSGGTISGATKTISIGNSGSSGSTTSVNIANSIGAPSGAATINIGVTGGPPTTTTNLGGTVNASTASVDTNSTVVATTAFVVGQAGSATPLVDGTAAVGTSLRYARADHVHPTDTSRAATASPTFTGTPLSTTAAVDTNTTQIATTAFVVAQAASATPLADGTAAVGTSLRYARADHVHPTDTSRAALNSPAFTGTPSLPTGTTAVTQTAGNNTTAVATTAFVTAAVPAIATVAQVYASTSSTTATPPLLAPLAFNSGGYFPRMNFANTTSGTGASVGGADHRFEIIGPNVSTAGFAQITSEHQQLWSAGTTFTILQFSKPVWLSFRMCNFSATYDGDAQTEIKAFIGNAVTGGIDPTAAAVGIYKAGGAGSFINLMVHDGTTLTKVATTTTFSTTVVDVAIYSNNGTVNLYLNGVLAATTTAGPTGTSNTTRVIASVKATATAAVRQLMEIANIKVFAPQ